jgi:hypothetical protein
MRLMLRALLAALLALAALPLAAAERTLLFSYEATSSQLGLTRLRDAPYADRAAFTAKAAKELLPEIFRAVGLDPAKVKTEMTPGGYLLRTNASLQSRIAIDQARADRVAAALGYVFRQSSVLVSDLWDTKGGTGTAMVRFAPGSLTPGLAHAFFEHAAQVHKGLGGGYTAFGNDMIFLNVRDDAGKPYSGLDDRAFFAQLGQAAARFKGGKAQLASTGQARARFVGNSWRQKPNGEDYVALLGGAGSAEIIRLDRLKDRHTALILHAADHYGWK